MYDFLYKLHLNTVRQPNQASRLSTTKNTTASCKHLHVRLISSLSKFHERRRAAFIDSWTNRNRSKAVLSDVKHSTKCECNSNVSSGDKGLHL